MRDSEIFNYAIRHYDNPSCKTTEEFAADYATPIKIKRLLTRRANGVDVSLRLVLNHILTMFNVFSPHASVIMLFIRTPKEHHSIIKTFLVFLNYMPDNIDEINIDVSLIELDPDIVAFLRSI
jgi:hypothetical protein